MAKQYSIEVCRELEEKIRQAQLHRPARITRYEAGTELAYDITSVDTADTGRVYLVVDRFVGGGFAGQVYRVRVKGIEVENKLKEQLAGLRVEGIYAMKILVPPSGFSRLFRSVLYWIGFQGPFQLQVNPAAARAGALWQKFIRRGAKICFGDENAVVDIYATFVDNNLGSCGELSQWIRGRTWRLEVDEHMDTLRRWTRGETVDEDRLGSPEYRTKKQFMADFVNLLHNIGAYEFARQYEWSTCKSQPNCLKRMKTGKDPLVGLVVVDFRAGLALLPFLPMSPGDFKLIWQGLKRGSIVQFDRGDIAKLERFMQAHSNEFGDMWPMLEELKAAECVYRDSVVDITHNYARLFSDRRLWSTIFDSTVTGWRVRNLVDEECEKKLRDSRVLAVLFFTIGLIPFLGKLIRRIWAHAGWRTHYDKILTSFGYFRRAFNARIAEKVISWHRAGRVGPERAVKLVEQPWWFFCHLPFLLLIFPALHRFFTDWQYFKGKLYYIFVRPVALYFSSKLRNQWMRQMITDGKKKHILSDEDAQIVRSNLKEPYIQRYLVSLVVHLLTLPVTQIVSVIHATIWYMGHPEASDTERAGVTAAILLAYQIIPVSPGSFCRGLYTTCLAIYDRNFKDYNIALFLSYFKYVGYLAFPIQMTYHYPVLARFMAGHWATEATHIVPVFGERGALLEHWVFCLFYNWPLTIRRKMRKLAQVRASIDPRYWHVGLYTVIGAAILSYVDFSHIKDAGSLPVLKEIWLLFVIVPLFCGRFVSLGCGGAVLWKRIVAATFCGIVIGILSTGVSAIVGVDVLAAGEIAKSCVWRVFVLAILSTMGALITELRLPDPDLK